MLCDWICNKTHPNHDLATQPVTGSNTMICMAHCNSGCAFKTEFIPKQRTQTVVLHTVDHSLLALEECHKGKADRSAYQWWPLMLLWCQKCNCLFGVVGGMLYWLCFGRCNEKWCLVELLCFNNKFLNLEIKVSTKTYNDRQILSMDSLNRGSLGLSPNKVYMQLKLMNDESNVIHMYMCRNS